MLFLLQNILEKRRVLEYCAILKEIILVLLCIKILKFFCSQSSCITYTLLINYPACLIALMPH